jgi:DNA-binding transcriptional LysR family regulator
MVARERGFTAAAKAVGLSQSALTRQVQKMEERIGFKIFERTTRAVRITEAGAMFLRETDAIPNILRGAMRRLREEFLEAPRVIRVGVSSDLAMAHISGVFHRPTEKSGSVSVTVEQGSGGWVHEEAAAARLDVGVLTAPRDSLLRVTTLHELEDRFVMIVPAGHEVPDGGQRSAGFRKWVSGQRWLLPPKGTVLRELISDWESKQRFRLNAAMELENFDLMVELVSLGLGLALVPRRSLGPFRRKHLIQKVALGRPLNRRLVVVVPEVAVVPEHVRMWIEGILFS